MSYSSYSIRHFVEQELGTVPHFIIYAVLEWTLIGLLFLDGFLTFVSSEFADFFDLQAPCVLCTRIDHILTRNKSRYCYNESICDGHKTNLSSLAYCHVHRKLSDIRTMCEGCLLSFATENNKSDCKETYKPFNGGLNKDFEGLFNDELMARLQLQPLRKGDTTNGKGNGKVIYCSCCGEPMKVKSTKYQKSTSNIGNNNSSYNPGSLSRVPSRLSQQAPTPSPRAPFVSWRAEEALKTLELSQIRCQELKLSEDNTPNQEEMTTNIAIPFVNKEDLKPITTPRPLTTPRSTEHKDFVEDFGRNFSFSRENKILGISDSATSSPRFANRMPRKSILEKVELSSDPVDAIIGNETDSEIIMSRLKKQVRSDRKSLIALYMELDEERGASAVAANNAMAMITRLQAEKASVQMEALQYQRMMEEQAEYDKEDIQLLKDYLNKKEDEIRDLEAELDLYRDRHGLPDLSRDDRLEESQSFSSITEHGSPLFCIVPNDMELDVREPVSDKTSDDYDFKEDDINGESSYEDECEHTRHYNDDEDDVGESPIDIEHEGSFLLGQLRTPGVQDNPMFT